MGLGVLFAAGCILSFIYFGESRSDRLAVAAISGAAAAFWFFWAFRFRSLRLELDGHRIRYERPASTQECPIATLVEVRWVVNGDGVSDSLDFLDAGKRVFSVPDVFGHEEMKQFLQELLRQNSGIRLAEDLRTRFDIQ